MSIIHCISGLGADERVFKKLAIPGVEFRYVPWPYLDPKDDMLHYAEKIAALIPSGPDDHILGLSFGGMLASEIALMRPGQKVFLISSCKSPAELPPLNPVLRFFARNRLVFMGMLSMLQWRFMTLFGVENDEERSMVREVMADSDPHFVRCAGKVIIEWKMNQKPRPDLIQIHGTADRILPPQYVKPTIWIKNGHHLMVFSRAKEISALIAQYL
ncbi:MAG: alpha/beta hydrolase [Bacteroidetes bacterium]|nr:alpha/beta hydrolase [Bacteroidota bacterium]MBS1630691.1 alpha/beta hydrolase [Bacteroidota bacterium]